MERSPLLYVHFTPGDLILFLRGGESALKHTLTTHKGIMKDYERSSESQYHIYEDAKAMVWTTYDVDLNELSQLSLDERIVSLCQVLRANLTHFDDYHEFENVELSKDDPSAADHVMGSKFMLYECLDSYAEDILGYVPEHRDRASINEEFEKVGLTESDEPHAGGGDQ